jgi:hypothetical protein
VYSLGRHTSALSGTSLDDGGEGPPSADRERHFAATGKSTLGPRLFNTRPAILNESYANFAIAEPPLKPCTARAHPADIALWNVSKMAVHNIP